MAAGSMRKPWRGRALVAMGTCIFSTCTEANQSHSDALLYYYIALHSQHSLSHGRVVLLIFFLSVARFVAPGHEAIPTYYVLPGPIL